MIYRGKWSKPTLRCLSKQLTTPPALRAVSGYHDTISDPLALSATYPFNLTQIAQKIKRGSNWAYAQRVRYRISHGSGIHIKAGDNKYHRAEKYGKSVLHRYSEATCSSLQPCETVSLTRYEGTSRRLECRRRQASGSVRDRPRSERLWGIAMRFGDRPTIPVACEDDRALVDFSQLCFVLMAPFCMQCSVVGRPAPIKNDGKSRPGLHFLFQIGLYVKAVTFWAFCWACLPVPNSFTRCAFEL